MVGLPADRLAALMWPPPGWRRLAPALPRCSTCVAAPSPSACEKQAGACDYCLAESAGRDCLVTLNRTKGSVFRGFGSALACANACVLKCSKLNCVPKCTSQHTKGKWMQLECYCVIKEHQLTGDGSRAQTSPLKACKLGNCIPCKIIVAINSVEAENQKRGRGGLGCS